MELVGPSYRVLACAILSICFALGEILLGVAAWYIYSWRTFLRVVYAPGFILIFYYWLIPESLRWLISKNRISKVQHVLKRMSKINNKHLSDKSLEVLLNVSKYWKNHVFIENYFIYMLFWIIYCDSV